METILVINDDPAVHRVLRHAFSGSGFALTRARNGSSAVKALRRVAPRAVIMGQRLPGASGLDLCREIRTRSPNVPILVLSSVTDEVHKVLLLELGADDYITKPFRPREVLARVRAAVRRLDRSLAPSDKFVFDDIVVNFLSMELSRAGKSVPITPKEFKVLQFFVHNQGRVISESELLKEVWEDQSQPPTSTIRTHILRLRQKLEPNPKKPTHFLTVRGAGYKFIA